MLEYEWPDHQAPPVTTLFDIAAKCHQYLKSKGWVMQMWRTGLWLCTATMERAELGLQLLLFCYFWGAIKVLKRLFPFTTPEDSAAIITG